MKSRASLLCTALCLAGISSQAVADDWDWIVAPYAWLPTISTDLERDVPPAGGVSTDTAFDDILDNLDGAFLLHIEGQSEEFGVFSDFIYFGLGKETDRPRFRTESDIDARLFELAGVWSPGDGTFNGFELFGGLRYIDLDLAVQFDPIDAAFPTTDFETGQTYYDLMLGVRYTAQLSDRWGVTFRGDGSGGDTEGTWNASATLSYRMNSGSWLLGYRYLSAELQDFNSTTEITLNGPMFGYGFAF